MPTPPTPTDPNTDSQPPLDFQRLEELFHLLVDQPPEERDERLEELAEQEPELVAELRRMLTADRAQTVALGSSDSAGSLPDQESVEQPAAIGPYRIVRRIGTGGMGVVYEGEQVEPIARRVAIKLVKSGIDSRELLRRFEIERKMLARLEHEGIARVFETGATGGRPWFAMEYVDGRPITDYADQEKLDTDQRLRLFSDVCQAIQHAHQRGVIHRDLKPTNILVTEREGRPQIKVIDFGIAKALDPEEDAQTLFTRAGQIIGTPEYMSPEQAGFGSAQIDTRSDVYSLGVILYELLVGRLPIDSKQLRKAGHDAMRRLICEIETPKPSSQLEATLPSSLQAAESRRASLASLRRALRGELDWIVLRAMAKDPERRYGSPRELAADLERHLTGQAIEAGPPNFGYRARKFVRRYRIPLSFVAVGVTALLVTTLVSLVALQRTRAAEAAARVEATTANRVTDFLVELFESNAPGPADSASLSARDILNRGAARIEDELSNEPVIKARLLETLGHIYGRLGQFDDAQRLLRQGLELNEQTLGRDHPSVASSLHRLGYLEVDSYDRPEAARPLLEQAVAILSALPDRTHEQSAQLVDALANLSFAHQRFLDYDLAQEALDEAERIALAELGERSIELGHVLNRVGVLRQAQNDYEGSLGPFQQALSIAREVWGDQHRDVAVVGTNLAWSYIQLGRPADAIPLFETELSVSAAQLGENHRTIANTLLMLAQARTLTTDYRGARDDLERAIEINRQVLGDDHYSVTEVLYRAAELEVFASRPEDGYQLFLEVRRRLEESDNSRAPVALVRDTRMAVAPRAPPGAAGAGGTDLWPRNRDREGRSTRP